MSLKGTCLYVDAIYQPCRQQAGDLRGVGARVISKVDSWDNGRDADRFDGLMPSGRVRLAPSVVTPNTHFPSPVRRSTRKSPQLLTVCPELDLFRQSRDRRHQCFGSSNQLRPPVHDAPRSDKAFLFLNHNLSTTWSVTV